MRSNPTNSLKTKKYVYTEKDLGEGLLDEGVTNPYFLQTTNKTTRQNLSAKLLKFSLLCKESINVQEDFTYVYY